MLKGLPLPQNSYISIEIFFLFMRTQGAEDYTSEVHSAWGRLIYTALKFIRQRKLLNMELVIRISFCSPKKLSFFGTLVQREILAKIGKFVASQKLLKKQMIFHIKEVKEYS